MRWPGSGARAALDPFRATGLGTTTEPAVAVVVLALPVQVAMTRIHRAGTTHHLVTRFDCHRPRFGFSLARVLLASGHRDSRAGRLAVPPIVRFARRIQEFAGHAALVSLDEALLAQAAEGVESALRTVARSVLRSIPTLSDRPGGTDISRNMPGFRRSLGTLHFT